MQKKSFLTGLSFIIFLVYFTFLGILIPFLASIPLKNGGFKTLYSQNDVYKMIDNFYDPDEFYSFRQEAENINILSDFYNKLNTSKDFDILTSFNQAIVITDFKGDNSFYYNSDEFIEKHPSSKINIKSFQLNQKAYHFYNIEVDSGQGIPWDNVSYKSARIPVLLGADYKKYYHNGDIIRGNYYSKDMEFEVVGFLKDNCSIKYKNVFELNLDTYMLIPYPPNLWKVSRDFQFESILYFAMLNCDIVPFVNETQVLKDVNKIANQTGFTNFSLVGIDNFQIQNIELLLFIQKHKKIFAASIIAVFIFINIIGIKIFRLILKEKCTIPINQKEYTYIKIFTLHIIIPYGMAFILSIFLSINVLKKLLPISIFSEIAVLLFMYIITYIFGRKEKVCSM